MLLLFTNRTTDNFLSDNHTDTLDDADKFVVFWGTCRARSSTRVLSPAYLDLLTHDEMCGWKQYATQVQSIHKA